MYPTNVQLRRPFVSFPSTFGQVEFWTLKLDPVGELNKYHVASRPLSSSAFETSISTPSNSSRDRFFVDGSRCETLRRSSGNRLVYTYPTTTVCVTRECNAVAHKIENLPGVAFLGLIIEINSTTFLF